MQIKLIYLPPPPFGGLSRLLSCLPPPPPEELDLSEVVAFHSGYCYHIFDRVLGLPLTQVLISRSIFDYFLIRIQ
jgi:hypothetical protein